MVSREILSSIDYYLQEVREAGIKATTAVLFGSYAEGTATADSDIDLIIIAPEFDQRDEAQVNLLWELRAFSDPRIEPIACGSRQWLEDESSPILSIARDSGVVFSLDEVA
ncbi:MAG: nucleotidyltransferase domain-containing protein [Anaerolinea sp.]|nr:nucleotidyltransferase domain-containing protein [Anaerolinea sp.]